MLKNVLNRFNEYCKTILRLITTLVVTVFIGGMANAAVNNSLDGLRAWPSPDETRVVLDVNSEVDFSYFTLTNPERLVVDLKQASLKTKLPLIVKDSAILSKVRQSSPPDSGTIRLVFELKRKTTPTIFKLRPTPGGQYGHRLVLDLPHNISTSSQTTSNPSASNSTTQTSTAAVKKRQDILIVIDPGHGGDDPGSIGPTRKYEKNVTLMVAKKIAAQLNETPGVKTRLTRNRDYFVNLNRRVAIARENDAHLLLSIHADAYTTPQPKGASVFVLNTRRANTEISRWVEDHEKQSEILGGGNVLPSSINDKNVNQTLLDLQFSHSQKEGYKLAVDILSEMGKVAKLHNTKPINTSLAVLRSPQIPSVLIETGFISNPSEEKLLFQNEHQDKLAKAITQAVIKYLKANPPEGLSLTQASKTSGTKVHKVQQGESLSLISQRYDVSMQAIIDTNKLKSKNLIIGQKLTIPESTIPKSNSNETTTNSTISSTTNLATSSELNPAPATNAGSTTDVTTTTTAQTAPPTAVKTAVTNYQVVKHSVKSGDYLSTIAQQYQVSVASIKRENNLKSNTLQKGQVLNITVAAPVMDTIKQSDVKVHVVQRGEYLSKIATQYGVSMAAIQQNNKLKSSKLVIGQKLIIPTQ